MVLGVNYSRCVDRLRHSNRARISVGIASVIALHLISASSGFTQPSASTDGRHAIIKECPPGEPPKNCADISRMAYKSAIGRGYANTNGNNVPDVMERRYQIGFNDCSTGNAHIACMYNVDPCLSKHGTLSGLRSNSAGHATVLYEGKDGATFECDFTPGNSTTPGNLYLPLGSRRDTQVGPAFPDAGESIDPQYAKDGCQTNGASSSALNPGGGGGGGGGGGLIQGRMLTAIMQLFTQLQNQKDTNDNQVVIPAPTATPTPSPTSIPNTRSSAARLSKEASDAAIVSGNKNDILDGSMDSQNGLEGDDTDEDAEAAEKLRTVDLELEREGLF